MLKKFALLLLFSTLLACSSDDNANTVSNGEKVLIKRMTTTGPDFEGSSVTEYDYENEKLTTISDRFSIATFSYEGDKITSIDVENLIGQYQGEINHIYFFYNGNQLASTIVTSDFYKTAYSFQNNLLVSEITSLSESPNILISSKDYSYINGNAVSMMDNVFLYDENPLPYSKTDYTFDTKNNMTRDFSPYMKQAIFTGLPYVKSGLSKNNILTEKKIDLTENRVTYTEYRYEYVYNAKDFPIEVKKFNVTTNTLLTITAIEYL